MQDREQMLTRQALATRLQVHPKTVDRWVRGIVGGVRLRTVRVGGRTRVRWGDYLDWQAALDGAKDSSAEKVRRPNRKAFREAAARHGMRV